MSVCTGTEHRLSMIENPTSVAVHAHSCSVQENKKNYTEQLQMLDTCRNSDTRPARVELRINQGVFCSFILRTGGMKKTDTENICVCACVWRKE